MNKSSFIAHKRGVKCVLYTKEMIGIDRIISCVLSLTPEQWSRRPPLMMVWETSAQIGRNIESQLPAFVPGGGRFMAMKMSSSHFKINPRRFFQIIDGDCHYLFQRCFSLDIRMDVNDRGRNKVVAYMIRMLYEEGIIYDELIIWFCEILIYYFLWNTREDNKLMCG